MMKYKLYSLCMLVFVIVGCGATTTETKRSTRVWEDFQYTETWTIRTEPSESRVYINDEYIGISPIEIPVHIPNVQARQQGRYVVQYDYNTTVLRGPNNRFNEKRLTDTEWDGGVFPIFNDQVVNIAAFMDGYEPTIKKVILKDEDQTIKKAFSNISPDDEGRFNRPTNSRSILVILRPLGSPDQPNHNEQQQATGQIHKGNASYEQAKREYDVALSAYNKALEELDSARNMRSLSNMSFGTLMGGSKLDRAVGLLNQGTTHLSLQDAERNVQIARERLERAKARLDAINWK